MITIKKKKDFISPPKVPKVLLKNNSQSYFKKSQMGQTLKKYEQYEVERRILSRIVQKCGSLRNSFNEYFEFRSKRDLAIPRKNSKPITDPFDWSVQGIVIAQITNLESTRRKFKVPIEELNYDPESRSLCH